MNLIGWAESWDFSLFVSLRFSVYDIPVCKWSTVIFCCSEFSQEVEPLTYSVPDHLSVCSFLNKFCCECYLDDGDEAFVGNGISRDGEASGWIPWYDPVHCIPGRSPRFIFVSHGEIRHYHIHTVLWDLTVELQRQAERDRFSAKMALARCVFKCLCVCVCHSQSLGWTLEHCHWHPAGVWQQWRCWTDHTWGFPPCR